MKSFGKFEINISIERKDGTKEDILKNRTVYFKGDDRFMFFKGKYIPVTVNNEQYFASYVEEGVGVPNAVS